MKFTIFTILSLAAAAPVNHEFSKRSSTSVFGDLASRSSTRDKFEDGTIKCSDFPSGSGVIPVDWIDLDGWSTISDANGASHSTCEDGYYCSYACQAGMGKTQWPSSQPSTGSTVGGLYCKNGYLYRTDTSTDYLCEWGSNKATADSDLDDVVAICRTDYPGSENMNIPTELTAGNSTEIFVVDEDNYFEWENKKTSAQYYVNNAGVSVEDGCIWGESSGTVGNWAPIIIGAGYTNDNAYLSISTNSNSDSAANFNVEIIAADDDSTLVGTCVYENGAFTDGSSGCTVTVTSGKAKFHFY